METREAACTVCRFPITILNSAIRGDEFPCDRCGTVNAVRGFRIELTTAARLAIYTKFDGDGVSDHGLCGHVRARYDAAYLAEKDSRKRAELLLDKDIELRDLTRAKAREMYRVKKAERGLVKRLIAEGKMPHPSGRSL